MKATGIVRRIDDLGRVVIPKEIRRTMRIREGDPLEIYTDREGEVIFKKYSPIGELVDFAGQYAESVFKSCGVPVAVCDRDCVIAVAGIPKKEYLDKKISQEMDTIIERRGLFTPDAESGTVPLIDDGRAGVHTLCAMPVISEGDVIGCVASVGAQDALPQRTAEKELDTEVKLIRTAAYFLGKQYDK